MLAALARRPVRRLLLPAAALALAVGAPASAPAATWHAPQTLTGPVSLSVPHVGLDARGDGVVAWVAGDRRIVAALRRAGGRFGAARVIARAAAHGRVLEPQVAVSSGGDAVVAWAEEAPGRPHFRIRAALAAGARAFAAPRTIGGSTTAWRAQPRVVAAPGGGLLAGWYRDDVGLQLAARAPGRPFGTPRTTLTLPYTPVWWAIAPDGRLHLVWTADGPGGTFVATAVGRLGGRFGPIGPLSQTGGSAPVLAVSPNDTPVAAWREPGAVLAAAGRPGFTLLDPAQTVSPADAAASAPQLAAGPHSAAAVGWGGAASGWPPDRLGMPAWLATRASGAPFAAAQALTPAGAFALAPQLAFDAGGTLTAAVVWADGADRHLEIRQGAAGAPLPAAAVTATSRPGDLHPVWTSAAVAAAGRFTAVAWTAGGQGPVRVFTQG
ncbi:hypothetical protein FSW04_24365 [Baekduia soli]|uniref:WD40 repeat domain-containing protein n=1 Tax=Baekduia soli TaxID=496014 RepID=A0A5B8UBJ7_9ACTN|nr:hypothetical protein [Baekduia soli]QEC50410.1 hypothetical protein FSW04_24365 [Baekduia soli]